MSEALHIERQVRVPEASDPGTRASIPAHWGSFHLPTSTKLRSSPKVAAIAVNLCISSSAIDATLRPAKNSDRVSGGRELHHDRVVQDGQALFH